MAERNPQSRVFIELFTLPVGTSGFSLVSAFFSENPFIFIIAGISIADSPSFTKTGIPHTKVAWGKLAQSKPRLYQSLFPYLTLNISH
ncbi:hypothetical protein CU633_21890 [Bacillus sp. V3-13]|nr:hypothetical protein CU633_21890 [Bacillus sp. V3-13]